MRCTRCGCAEGLSKLRGTRSSASGGGGGGDQKTRLTKEALRALDAEQEPVEAVTKLSVLQKEHQIPAPAHRTHSHADPHWANGFRVLPEIETIRVDEGSIARFSLTSEAVAFKSERIHQICEFQNGDRERMIHCNTKLDDQELRELESLRSLAQKKNCAFSPSISVAATRFISDARGDIPKALEKMKASQEWRNNFFKDGPITAESVREDLAHGVIYFAGRDKSMRPAIVARPARVPQRFRNDEGAQRLTRVLIFCLEYFLRYMAIPGQIENILVILDVKDLGPFSLPWRALMSIAGILSQQHAGRVWRFYVVNMPRMLSYIGDKIVQNALTDRQAEKIVFVEEDRKVLLKDFERDQLEKDLGGSRSMEKAFFPFPLPPSSRKVVDPDVSHVHKLLTDRGAQGRLWNSNLSFEENTQLEYSAVAKDILHQCHMPLPLVLTEDRLPAALHKAAHALEDKLSAALHVVAPQVEEAPMIVEDGRSGPRSQRAEDRLATIRRDSDSSDEGHIVQQHEVIMEDVDICTPQVFSCMACRCTVGVTKREKAL